MQYKARTKVKMINPRPIPDILSFAFAEQISMAIYHLKRRVVRSSTPTIEHTVALNNAPINNLILFCLDLESSSDSELGGFQTKNADESISPDKQEYITHAKLLLNLFSTFLYPSYPDSPIPHAICSSIFQHSYII